MPWTSEGALRKGTLTGKKGDYLVKHYRDRQVLYPEDVWILDAKVFEATFEEVGH